MLLPYFPVEIEEENKYLQDPDISSNPIISYINKRGYYERSIRPFYDNVVEILQEQEEAKVMVADPAHDIFFGYIHYAFPFTQAAEVGVLLDTIAHEKMSRRSFFTTMMCLASAVKVADRVQVSYERKENKPLFFSEATFRRAVVADLLVDLSENSEYDGAKINLLYPPVHIQGIKQMIESPLRRKAEILTRRLDLLMLLPSLRESLFSLREYQWDINEGYWKKTRKCNK